MRTANPKHTRTCQEQGQQIILQGEHLLSYGPDIKAAPLSDVKKTKVLLSTPRLRNNDRI